MTGETLFARVVWPAGVVAFVVAGVAAAGLMELWHPLGYLFWLFAPAVFVVAARYFGSGQITDYRCEQCRYRVRNHARICHRCGSSVV
jgi:hypothetical protein